MLNRKIVAVAFLPIHAFVSALAIVGECEFGSLPQGGNIYPNPVGPPSSQHARVYLGVVIGGSTQLQPGVASGPFS